MIEKSIVKSVAGLLAVACVTLAFVLLDPGVRSQNTNGSETPQRPDIIINRGEAPAPPPPQDTGGGVQEDLSGTFTGRLMMTGGHEMSSNEATLTITGNTFSLTAEGMTHSGRIYAVNTRRYIGAALIFDDMTDPATNTPLACSVRVRRAGNRLSMTPVPGARNRLTFNGRSSS
ncbi:MAG TPA: hypothetical protein VFX96_04705 [Pyrinomonadaceae bacterium]|nr:hypothetical protein [Pyrinomonadaceae bacterium]